MMTNEQVLASITAMPVWATTAQQQIGCALDDIIAASRNDPVTN